MELRQTLFIYQDTIRNLAAALRISVKEAAQNERNIAIFTRQLGEISGTVIIIIGTEVDLCIFYKRKRNKTQDQATNTDGNLVLIIINKVVPYRDLKEIRRSYNIND
jgi:hypothetical protein